PHLIHIHLTDQQVISRNGKSPNPIEARGLKETHLLMADGERVEVLIKFTDHTGVYVFHCHILEHEDQFMMAQFEVVP
ncbi:MAG: multicopper oxidase domain-containing protein, partial [Chloroflexi bacterium]|nr:multicopper oxidase domain-containing protein [Chloroflexota bacterium]